MSKLTYKIRHNLDIRDELTKALLVAKFAVEHRTMSSNSVKQFGLKSAISNQILRKYSRNWKCKRVNSVKLTIPGSSVDYMNRIIRVPCLKAKIYGFMKDVIKINQIELDETHAYICCTVADICEREPGGYIGIDRNATGHIAVAAIDEKIMKFGKDATHINGKYRHIRAHAQRGRKFKFLKKLKNKESNKTKNINHQISRKIVDIAKEKNYGIKLEKLTGITKNKRQGKKLNSIKSNWSFYQLQTFIAYKAKLLGVKVFFVDPAFTSQTCSRCGLLGTRDKKQFECPSCGHKDHADANASFNIAKAVPLQNPFPRRQRCVGEPSNDSAQVVELAGGERSTTEPTSD